MYVKLQILPGIVKTETDYSQEGRYIDGDKVRFVRGLPQKIGGWEDSGIGPLDGKCRGIRAWRSNDGAQLLAFGTNSRVYVFRNNTLSDRTPADETGTLTDPFSVTSGSTSVTVTDATHGRAVGNVVQFSGATAVGGITIDGEYTVTSVPTSSTYTMTHSSAASSTATGGGTVSFVYLLGQGPSISSLSFGYGTGAYGGGSYGTPRTSGNQVFARTWTLDNFGEDLVACPRSGAIYWYDVSAAGSRLVTLGAGPSTAEGIFVTPERFLVAFGVDNNKLKVQWADQESLTDWTPSLTNQARSTVVSGGSRLIAGGAIRAGVSMLWSDTDCFSLLYTGDDFVFRADKQGSSAGIIGPKAWCEANGVAFWMGTNEFLMWNGFPQPIPNQEDIKRFVYDNLTAVQRDLVCCGFNAAFQEVWFWYPTGNDVDRYVAVNIRDWAWTVGSMARTAWQDEGVFSTPLAVDPDGAVYEHETGVDDDGAAMDSYIKAQLQDLNEGNDLFDIFGIIPDVKSQSGAMSAELYTLDKPNSSVVTDGPYSFTTSTDQIDTRASGRQAGFLMRSNVVGGNWRLGATRLDVRRAGGRR